VQLTTNDRVQTTYMFHAKLA